MEEGQLSYLPKMENGVGPGVQNSLGWSVKPAGPVILLLVKMICWTGIVGLTIAMTSKFCICLRAFANVTMLGHIIYGSVG